MVTILMDARVLGKRPSGVGIYIYNLVKALNKDERYQFVLVTDVAESFEMKQLKEDGVQIISYGRYFRQSPYIIQYYHFVQRVIHEVKPDIFWEGNLLCPINMKNPYGFLYTTIYDVFPVSEPQYYSFLYRQYFKIGLQKTIHSFDRLIYDSDSCRKSVEKYFPESEKRRNSVGYVIVPQMPKMAIYDNGAFLYIGNLEKRKGTDILLKAYALYRKKGGERPLRLAGKMREKEIQILLDQVRMEYGNIQYLGYISSEEKATEYAGCHAFLFPSQAEGFGIPVIEAMQYEKPVIASRLDTLEEITKGCVTFFDTRKKNNDDAAEELCKQMLMDNQKVDRQMYHSIVHKYSAEEIAQRYQAIIMEDLQEKK